MQESLSDTRLLPPGAPCPPYCAQAAAPSALQLPARHPSQGGAARSPHAPRAQERTARQLLCPTVCPRDWGGGACAHTHSQGPPCLCLPARAGGAPRALPLRGGPGRARASTDTPGACFPGGTRGGSAPAAARKQEQHDHSHQGAREQGRRARRHPHGERSPRPCTRAPGALRGAAPGTSQEHTPLTSLHPAVR